MTTTDFRTVAKMAEPHPLLLGDAARFRVTRLLEGEEAARAQLRPDSAALVDQWHRLQALEGAKLHVVG